MLSYWLLFLSAFGAATLLPFYSEIAVIGLLENGNDPVMIGLVATLGNTLGAAVNWVLGRWLTEFRQHRWFPFSEKQMRKGEGWFHRYGVWSLLFAWLPVGGDALTFIAGVLKVNFWLFLMLTGIGKGLRYCAVIAAYLNLV